MKRWLALAWVMVTAVLGAVGETSAARRFLVSDFMNRKLTYVDEANPASYWQTFLPEVAFDLTRCGTNLIVVSQRHGCRVYDWRTKKVVAEISDPAHLRYATSALRFADGRTWILDGASVHTYAADGSWERAYAFGPRVKRTRIMRTTPGGTLLIGADSGIAEVVMDAACAPEKRLKAWYPLPEKARYAYQAEYAADGSLVATGGYLPEVFRLAPDGTLRARHRAAQPDGLENFFYGGFVLRSNGHCVVANWTGHDGRDFRPGWKLIEFAPDGSVVWHWNAPWAGTINAVLLFD